MSFLSLLFPPSVFFSKLSQTKLSVMERTRILNTNTPSVTAFIQLINMFSPEGPYIHRQDTHTQLLRTVLLKSHKPLANGLFRIKRNTLEIRQVKTVS